MKTKNMMNLILESHLEISRVTSSDITLDSFKFINYQSNPESRVASRNVTLDPFKFINHLLVDF